MPIRHHIRPDLGLAVSIHTGSVTDQEFLESYRALFESPDYDLGFGRLVDLRRTDSSTRSGEALRTIASYVKGRYANVTLTPKTAVVAPHDVSFGLARMYEAFSRFVPGDVVVFRSADAALAWLGISAERVPEVQRSENLEGNPT